MINFVLSYLLWSGLQGFRPALHHSALTKFFVLLGVAGLIINWLKRRTLIVGQVWSYRFGPGQ